jgi:trafficking protein particle complex subunit 9
MFYDLITHVPQPSHLALAPFDLYREPLVILAIADGAEICKESFTKRQSSGGRSREERNIRNLYQELEELRDGYTKVLVHQVLIFDYKQSKEDPIPIPEGMFAIPSVKDSKRTTMKTIMCDVSSLLLAEMTTLAKSFEAMTYIESPGQSASVRQLNGSSWAMDDMGSGSRRNSQHSVPTISRSTSASGAVDRAQNRMSMPIPPKGSSFGSASSTPARPSTPVRSGLSNPPTTFEDLEGGIGLDPSSPETPSSSRPGTAEGFRTQSSDRISVQGFGPGGLNDRWRNKGKGRVAIVMGSLYLQAGRWTDALKELIDGATLAKSINDHLWHGKALELIVVGLVLLGWAGLEFTVPHVCLPVTDKPDKPSPAMEKALEAAEKLDPTQEKWLRNLQVVLPELLERIIGLYSRISAEHLPPLPLAETTIRFCKLLSALHVYDGKLSKETLQMMVLGTQPNTPLDTSPRITVIPGRTSIVSTLFRAYPAPSSELLTTVDRIVILSGIASVLGMLGFQRKKSMVIRELVRVLRVGLVEARTRGAAEVGIHPAAGLVAVNGVNGHHTDGAAALDLGEGDTESGMGSFLSVLMRTYGVVESDLSSTPDHSDAATIVRIQKQSMARLFGMRGVKLDILRDCIDFSEALPDLAGVLKFSGDLLRTAGTGVAHGQRQEGGMPAISRDEQIRLTTNIAKASSLSLRLGSGPLAAEYWDEFLVRSIKLEPPSSTRVAVEHKKSELQSSSTARSSQDVNPFIIHNAFLKPPDKAAVEQTLVAGESASFKITLQNLYEVYIEIETIRLDTEGVTFESGVESAHIRPYSTHTLKISGIPRASGNLFLTGAIIKIAGCRERRFSIFPHSWAPEGEAKVKKIGLSSLSTAPQSPTGPPLKPEHVRLNVIGAQPVVAVKSTTLPQSSLMILEGQRHTFSVTLQNLSTTTPADFLLFSFQDSTQEPLQAALANRDATPAELYECELILAQKQALRIKRRDDEQRFIAPGQTATFHFEMLGKPGLTNASIQMDYAYLGVPTEDISAKFHTRQVTMDLTVTVNASVEIARIDLLPVHGCIPAPLWASCGDDGRGDGQSTKDKYCFMVLDLRNAWPSNMVVNLDMDDGTAVESHILPGNTTRVTVPVKRIYLEEPHAAVPALNPNRQRQYVVSTGKISPDMERANREAFWYREKILDSLRGSWKTLSGTARSGSIELRSIRLTPRMIEAIKVEEVGIEIFVDGSDGTGKRRNVIRVDSFARLRVRITNRTEQPIYPTLRLMPALSHRPQNVALDSARKFSWNGTLQQALPLLEGKTSAEVATGVTALCCGEFEITASVEETQLWVPQTAEEKRKSAAARPRSDTEILMDGALGPKERRIWYARESCRVVVKDEDYEEDAAEEEDIDEE